MVAKKSNKSDKKSSSKVNDVSKPGETPASSNARPTITGHDSTVKNDPMVAFSSKSNDEPEEEETKAKEEDTKKPYEARSKIVINPISKDSGDDEDKEDNKVKKDEGSDQEESADDEAVENTGKDDVDKQTEDTEEKSSSAGSDSAAIDALAQTADSKKVESKQEEEKKKHQEYIDGLVKSGGYRLPIIEGGHKGSAERFISWVFFLLLIASIGVYLAIDSGYLDIGFNVPFEFIND